MHERQIRLFLIENCLNARQDSGSNIEKRLVRLHNRQIVIRHDRKRIQHLLKHLLVLPRDADNCLHLRAALQLIDQRTHLDALRSSSENKHDFLHLAKILLSRISRFSSVAALKCHLQYNSIIVCFCSKINTPFAHENGYFTLIRAFFHVFLANVKRHVQSGDRDRHVFHPTITFRAYQIADASRKQQESIRKRSYGQKVTTASYAMRDAIASRNVRLLTACAGVPSHSSARSLVITPLSMVSMVAFSSLSANAIKSGR